MGSRNRCFLLILAIVATGLSNREVRGDACHDCGKSKKTKKKLCLVQVCEEVEIPCYAGTCEQVFWPDRGVCLHEGYRCDAFYRFDKHCDCHCCQDGKHETLQCDCFHTCHVTYKEGCATLLGAKPTGCHENGTVHRRKSSHIVSVPTLKWVALPICDDCRKGKKH